MTSSSGSCVGAAAASSPSAEVLWAEASHGDHKFGSGCAGLGEPHSNRNGMVGSRGAVGSEY